MSSDDGRGAEAPKKPGFLRRLFGGAGAPVAPVAPEPEDEAELPPLLSLDDLGPAFGPGVPVAPMPDTEPDLPPLRSLDDLGPAPGSDGPAAQPGPAVEPELPPLRSLDDLGPIPGFDRPATPGALDSEDELPPLRSLDDLGPAFGPGAPASTPTLDTEPELPPLRSLDDLGPAPGPATAADADEAPRRSWWSRLKAGLARSSASIGQGIADVFTKRKLDADTLEELDDILIRADLGVATAARITAAVAKDRYDKTIEPDEVKAILAREVEAVLEPLARPLAIDASARPFTILVIGVNGSGKTTTIGKLAAKFTRAGHSVMLAAGDTFRAAAIEQLAVWGERAKAPVVTRAQGSDAAGLAFDAFKQATEAGTEVLIVDTAGRLQNRTELMDELAKVIRVLRKLEPRAPHAVLLVLDATVGQNAMSQVEIFGKIAGVTGVVMTKLDGTARGGILVAIADKFGLPIHFIGVGEGIDDLEPFTARDFARAIAGLDA